MSRDDLDESQECNVLDWKTRRLCVRLKRDRGQGQAGVLTVLVVILEEATQLAHAHPSERLSGLTVIEHPSGDARADALVQERDGGRGGDQVGDGREQLADQTRLVRCEEGELDGCDRD